MTDDVPGTLRAAAIKALSEADLSEKARLTTTAGERWFARRLGLAAPTDPDLPSRPGRPDKPDLVPPRDVPRRSVHTKEGRIAMIHALAHIELNAIDLALDIVARFCGQPIPRSFFDGWMTVAMEEAKHFGLLSSRLRDLGSFYGALPASAAVALGIADTDPRLAAKLDVIARLPPLTPFDAF